MLADAYFVDNESSKAIAHYERVIGLIPDDLNALNNLAWLYQEREDPRAIRLADRAAQLAPDNAAILDTAGWSHFRLGNRQRGMELLRKAASLAPDDPDIQYHLAAGLINTGQADEGKRLLAKIVESGGEFASRGDAERLLGRMWWPASPASIPYDVQGPAGAGTAAHVPGHGWKPWVAGVVNALLVVLLLRRVSSPWPASGIRPRPTATDF